MSQLSAGALAPDFTLRTTNGTVRRLSEALSAGPIVLVFYKASCPTSQFTLPYLQKISQSSEVRMWAVSQDDVEETRKFISDVGLECEVLVDEHPYAVSSNYELDFVPAIFKVEPDRNISISEFGFSKAGLNAIAGFDFFKADDGLPAVRPG